MQLRQTIRCWDKEISDHAGRIIAVSFFVLFLIGVLVCTDYGQGYDENYEMRFILPSNVKQMILDLHLSELYDLEFVQNDEIPSIRNSVERDHGVAVYYLYLPVVNSKGISDYQKHVIFSVLTFCVSYSSVIALYFIFRELFQSRFLAFTGALFLYLSPKFFSEFHYNNKDIVLLALQIDTALFALRAIKRKNIADIIAFSVLAAYCCNVKIIGFFFVGVLGIGYILYTSFAPEQRWDKKSIWEAVLAIVLTCLLFYAITPATWNGNVINYFTYCITNSFSFSRWIGTVYFQGVEYSLPMFDSLPRKYLPVQVAITTPIPVLLIIAAGGVYFIISLFQKDKTLFYERHFFALLFLMMALFPFLLTVVKGAVLYNGWRHFYFAEFGFLVLAGYGLQTILAVHPHQKSRTIIVLILLLMSVQLVRNHPYQFCCYNILAGRDASENYEMDYWNVSDMVILQELASNDSRTDITLSAIAFHTNAGLTDAYNLLSENDRKRISLTDDYENADYILFSMAYDRYAQNRVPDYFIKSKTYRSWGDTIAIMYQNTKTKRR